MLIQLKEDLVQELESGAFRPPAEKYESDQVASLAPVQALFEHLGIAPAQNS
jgi:hypothetical protein